MGDQGSLTGRRLASHKLPVHSHTSPSSSSSVPRSKSAKARKRRTELRQFLCSCGVKCAAFLLIAVFVVGLDRWFAGVIFPMPTLLPKPLLTQSVVTSAPTKVAHGKQIGFDLKEAQVDLTTKQLYDTIAFEDKDGGAWKQGWDVQYQGNEWDEQKLKVFVVPHSHNDPGWKLTVEEYYQAKTRHILSTIVQSLAKDSRRKFIWEEVSYLERWWRDASLLEKSEFVRLVRNGQLEIVGGGWVMNDEANSHYFAIVEQMMEGNLWLLDTVGVIPKNAWAIDPFGHSATMAYLLQRMGFKNMLIQRAHYEVKKALALEQNLEFIWRQSWDSENSSDIFCHMMPFYSYDVPHTCGPEPAVCCQFDFWRMPRYGGALRCPWHLDPVETAPDNVQERATKLLDQYRKKSTLYKSNTLLVPLGDDFRYTSLEEAELQFRNYQALFDYINSHPELKAQVHFGTLEDYFSSLRAEVESGGDNRHDAPKFPSLSGDFFTYADRVQDYWSGYYVSRPFYKAIDRVLEESLRAAEILFFLAQAYCQANDYHSFPLSFGKELVNARRNLALFQHHDGVTGTAKDHVVVDYGTRMHNSLSELQSFMAASVGALLNKDSPGVCNADQLSFFQPEQSRTSHDILASKKLVEVASGNTIQVVLFNPLEETVEQVITILVNSSASCLVDSNWASVSSQVSPDWTQGTSYLVTGRHRLQWQASIPPLGFQTYFILSSKDNAYCNQAVLSNLKIYNADKDFICPPPYKCSLETVETIRINNEHLTLSFASRSGMLQDLKSHKDGSHTNLVEDLCLYSSRGGAYLFLPQGQATSIVDADGLILVTEGPMMQEVSTIPNTAFDHTPVIRSARLFAGNSVQSLILEMEYHVELLDSTFNNKEIITRFKTDINSGKVFYSDLNGFQTIRRETYDKIPLQGNYYPMPSLAFLQDPEGRRFSVHSRQAVGVASLNNGFLEMMLDRRLTRDDDRGLGQGVLDNHPTNVVFHLLVESNISSLLTGSSSAPRLPSLLSHRVGSQLNYPLHAFLRKPKHLPDAQAEAKSLMPKWKVGLVPWASTFPCDLHLVSLKILRPLQFLDAATSKELQFGILLQRRGWDPSYCKKGGTDCRTLANGSFDLSDVLTGLTTSQIRKSSLTFLHEDLQVRGYIEQLHRKQITGASKRKISIDLKPMEIQAFKFALKHVR